MQLVLYVHRSGEGLPDHAKVIAVDQATADAVRPQAHGAVDEFLNDIRAGWTPGPTDAAAEKAAADARVAAAEQQLADAKKAQADAQKKADEEAAAPKLVSEPPGTKTAPPEPKASGRKGGERMGPSAAKRKPR